MKELESFLKQLAPILQFPHLQPDHNGACQLVISTTGLTLLFEFDDRIVPGTILISSPLGSPLTATREFYTQLLQANKDLKEALSYKKDEGVVYLHLRVSAQIQQEALKPLVDHFLEVAQTWQERLKTTLSSSSPPPSDPGSPNRFKV